MRNKGRLALAAALLTGAALPATATAQTPVYENAKRYFVCQGAQPVTKVQNTPFTSRSAWSGTAPSGSFRSGSGCGYLDTTLTGVSTANRFYDAPFGGTYDGAVKALTVELHDLVVGQGETNALGVMTLNVTMQVDGVDVLGPEGQDVEVVPVLSESGLSQSVRFSISGLDLPAQADRGLSVTIRSVFGAAWVFGAAEVPSHVELNPARLEPARIPA